MNGSQIRDMLMAKLTTAGFLTVAEKNATRYNENPFDLVAGDECTLGLFGFEIKGDRDDYSRLKQQLNAYEFACDSVFLVLHKKSPPDWLPNFIGIIRVFENGEAYIEQGPCGRDEFDISTDYEWEALAKANGLSLSAEKLRKTLDILRGIRRNILFNRFFAAHEAWGAPKYQKFFPFSDEQKRLLMGFDIPHQLNALSKDVSDLEKRLELLKAALRLSDSRHEK